MRAFYRGTVVFAMFSDKRAFESPTAIAYKLPAGTQRREGQKCQLFELEGEREVTPLLVWTRRTGGPDRFVTSVKRRPPMRNVPSAQLS